MRARIVEIDEFTMVLKDERKRFLTVDKKSLNFDYELGDTVEVERDKDGKRKFRVYGGNEPLEGSAYPLRPSVGHASAKKKPVREPLTGGTLVFFVAAVLIFLWQLVDIVSTHVLVDNATCITLNQSYNGSCTPHSVMLIVELTAKIILAILSVSGIAAIVARRRIARRIYAITCISAVVWVAIDWLIYGMINLIHGLPDFIITAVDLRSIKWIILLAILSGIVIPYLYKSERVRYTLTRR
mgnify:CR=1 FL=1